MLGVVCLIDGRLYDNINQSNDDDGNETSRITDEMVTILGLCRCCLPLLVATQGTVVLETRRNMFSGHSE